MNQVGIKCAHCGTALTWGVLTCTQCGLRVGAQSGPMNAPATATERSSTPRTVVEATGGAFQRPQVDTSARTQFEDSSLQGNRTVFEEEENKQAKTVFEGHSQAPAKTQFEGVGSAAKTVFEGVLSAPARTMSESAPPSSHLAASQAFVPSATTATVFIDENGAQSQSRLAGWLVCTEGALLDRDYRVSVGKNMLGRHPECSVLLSDASVSSNHATLWVERDTVTLIDNNSRNGLLVNGSRIFTPTTLVPYSTIRIGLLTLTWIPFSRAPDACE